MDSAPVGRARSELGEDRGAIAERPLTLVLDSGVVLAACQQTDGFDPFGEEGLVSPSLMRSECLSALHEALWRGEIDRDDAEAIRTNLWAAPIAERRPRRLREEAWRLADELGWAKTYGAEYVALAGLLECRMVTLDGRLRRGAARLGFVIMPHEL